MLNNCTRVNFLLNNCTKDINFLITKAIQRLIFCGTQRPPQTCLKFISCWTIAHMNTKATKYINFMFYQSYQIYIFPDNKNWQKYIFPVQRYIFAVADRFKVNVMLNKCYQRYIFAVQRLISCGVQRYIFPDNKNCQIYIFAVQRLISCGVQRVPKIWI